MEGLTSDAALGFKVSCRTARRLMDGNVFFQRRINDSRKSRLTAEICVINVEVCT